MWDLLLGAAVLPDEIRRIANEEWGFRTRKQKRQGGKPISRSGFYRIFGNAFYMGLIPRKDGAPWIGAHPPMVTREEFTRAQEILGRPGRPRPIAHDFPFTGLIKCGECGGFITVEEHVKPSGRRYVYYRCSHNRRNTERCHEAAISELALEKQLVDYLARLRISDGVLAFLRKRIALTVEAERARRMHVRTTLEGTVEGLRREEENLLSLRVRDLIDDHTFIERRQATQDRRATLETKLEAAKTDSEAIGRRVLETLEFSARVASAFANGTGVQKRGILEAVGLNYTLRARKVALEFKNPLRLVAEAGASFTLRSIVDDVRTWFENQTEYFSLPSLDAPGPVLSRPGSAWVA
jgi:hypothetical protein